MVWIDIGSERSGVRTVDVAPSASELDLDDTVFSGIKVEARTDRDGDRVYVRLEISGSARLTCDRTLVDYDQPLKGSYSVLYVPPQELAEFGEEEEGVRVLELEDLKIDITEAVRDTLMLAIPIRRVAPGAEDKDIKLSFGASEDEEDIDPRWAALKNLPRDEDPE